MKTKFYIHTLDGKPAYYDGTQIVFATKYGRAATTCYSLNEIRHQQAKSKEWRYKNGFKELWKLGYARFC